MYENLHKRRKLSDGSAVAPEEEQEQEGAEKTKVEPDEPKKDKRLISFSTSSDGPLTQGDGHINFFRELEQYEVDMR